MDRRRWIFLVFVVALVVAFFDVYSNGVRILDNWAEGFEVRFDEARPDARILPHVIASHTFTESADGVETFVLEQATGHVTLQGADTDEITIETEVRGMKPRSGGDRSEAFLIGIGWPNVAHVGETDGSDDGVRNTANVEYELSPVGELKVKLHPEPSVIDDTRTAYTETRITLPAELAVDLTATGGFVDIHNMRGSQRVNATGMMVNIVPAAAAPVEVTLSGGELTLSVPRVSANYSLEATLNPGSMRAAGVSLQHTRHGMRSVVKATLGEGVFPMEIDVTGGHVQLNVTD